MAGDVVTNDEMTAIMLLCCFHGFVMTVLDLWDRTSPLQHWCNAK
jgi:hypothetical protein